MPASVVMVETMLDKKEVGQLKAVPLSHQTVYRRTPETGTDIVDQLVKRLKISQFFHFRLTILQMSVDMLSLCHL